MPILQLNGITKSFGTLVANNCINFEVERGEVHGLIGENGAGKSTLMNIVYGLYDPDAGEIYVDGCKVSFKSPIEALNAGIGMLHQRFKLIPSLTVLENIALYLKTKSAVNFLKEAETKIRQLSVLHGFKIDINQTVSLLGAHDQQLVEIIKLFCEDYKILILDEPTSVLAGDQITRLLEQIKNWARMGYAIIFISHKLNEVMAISDRVTVLSKGSVTAKFHRQDMCREELIRAMIGSDLPETECKSSSQALKQAKEVLRVDNLSVKDKWGLTVVDKVSLQVGQGEIYGIAGVMGNGQDFLVDILTGTNLQEGHLIGGKIWINSVETTGLSASAINRKGINVAYIPPKAHEVGLAKSLSFLENALLRDWDLFGKYIVNWKKVYGFADNLIKDYSIAASSKAVRVGNLSGGNQLKAVIAREVEHKPDLLVVFDPCAGLDIMSIKKFETKLIEASKDAAVFYVGDDLDLLLSVSDRIGVMYKGKLFEVSRPFYKEEIGRLMTGGA